MSNRGGSSSENGQKIYETEWSLKTDKKKGKI